MATEVSLGAGRAPLLRIFGWAVCLASPGASSCETALRRSFGIYHVRTVVAVCVVASSREMAASLTPAGLSLVLFSGPFYLLLGLSPSLTADVMRRGSCLKDRPTADFVLVVPSPLYSLYILMADPC